MSKGVWSGPIDVYVVRTVGGKVLYVGITSDLRARFAVHKHRSRWWDPTSQVTVEAWPTWKAARRREALLIERLRPEHNKINWEIWLERADEVQELVQRGMTRQQIRAETGIPNNTLSRVMYEIQRRRQNA